MLFQGEEWGASSPFQYFTAYDDPVLGQAVADGRREEFAAFGWQPHEGNASQTRVPVMILAREWEEIF